MTDFLIALKSLIFHRRVNLSIALGVAAATAVLTGALIVGDSMRGSLRELTLDRLGRIDVIIFSEGFFREQLAVELKRTDTFQENFGQATPVIFFPNGTAETRQDGRLRNLGQVSLLGIRPEFWRLGDETVARMPELADDEVVINRVVADDLGIADDQLNDVRITIGIPKQSLLPADSSLGSKRDLVERIVDLKVVCILPARSLGRFGLHPTQIPPRVVFLPINTMQDALQDGILKYKPSRQQANAILLSSRDANRVVTPEQAEALAARLEPTMDDFGLGLKRVTQRFGGETVYDYFSLSSDRLVLPDKTAASIRAAFPDAVEVFTYLANDLIAVRDVDDDDQPDYGVPFSMVTATDLQQIQMTSVSGDTVAPLAEDQIAVTSWAAQDQNLQVGDRVRLSFFEPETTHGAENERAVELVVADIVQLVEPSQPPRMPRRRQIRAADRPRPAQPDESGLQIESPENSASPPRGDIEELRAEFDQRPTRANDPDFTPTVPGLTDAESIDRWGLPFETAGRIRPQDDDYWTYYRTTPKAFVSLELARRLWSSRFGETTSFRIPVKLRNSSSITATLTKQFRSDGHWPGIEVVPVKANGLQASSGSTPFDALFLSLSLFVIAAALVLVSLLFRLALQKRSDEMGTLLAAGFRRRRVGRLWMKEMLGVCLVGAVAGILLGVGYAALMLYGLKTWWPGAISQPFLNMHIGRFTLPLGLLLGTAICIATIFWSVRGARRRSVRELLSGQIDTASATQRIHASRFSGIIIAVCGVAALALTVLAATALAGESQAGGFMASGFLILVAALVWVYGRICAAGSIPAGSLTLARLSTTNAGRNPLRSTLTIGLVAVASFLILAISAFRLTPTEQGTAGFNYLATTSQPVFADLNTVAGQRETLLGGNDTLSEDSRVLSFRYKPGEDASCNNPYQSSQPQVLGVTESTMAYFDDLQNPAFSFTMTPGGNPWRLLQQPADDGAIPVIIDKNTAWYSLKVYMPGTEFTVDYDSGETVRFRLVGLLSNSVLQGMLLISEDNFTASFPGLSGYRTFLMKLDEASELDRLATSLSDQGFDAQATERLLSGFLAVQNTYLSTFQSLGLLGLLLGTFGLAAVQLRAVMERRQELGLMRAVGFTRSQLARMILIENAWLLLVGMAVGIVAALVTTLPHYFFGDATVPWLALFGMFGFIAVVGLLTSWLASRSVFNAPLIESLRAG
jgi:ABC-type antimicrobial peptide transport system permease subunit